MFERVAPPREQRIALRRGDVYFGAPSLHGDRRVFDEVFLVEEYATTYEGAVVADIGAHKGYFGAYALAKGARTVVSFEPEQTNFLFLERAATSHRARGADWRVTKAAVSARTGVVELRIAAASHSHSIVGPQGGDCSNTHVERVPTVPAASLLRDLCGLPGRRVVVKVDTEGAECEIVLETPSDEWRGVDEVFLEIHPFTPCSFGEIVHHMESAGLALVADVALDADPSFRLARFRRDAVNPRPAP